MSVVVYKNKKLYSDGRIVSTGTTIILNNYRKVRQFNNTLIGLVGNPCYADRAIEFLSYPVNLEELEVDMKYFLSHIFFENFIKGRKTEEDKRPYDASLILYNTNQDLLIDYDLADSEFLELDPEYYYTWGSGASFAKGALAAGATAKDSVRIACEFDPNCGGELFEVG